MTGQEKAALLLHNLPPTLGEAVLERLLPDQRSLMHLELQRLQQFPAALGGFDNVVAEFDFLVEQLQPSQPSGSRRPGAKDFLPANLNDIADPVGALRQLSADRLFGLLQGEKARTIALVMNTLAADQAGEVLKRLPPPLRREVSVQLGDGVTARREVMELIARALLGKSASAGEKPAEVESKTRFKRMAEILRLLEDTERAEVLAALEEHDPEVASAIKAFLYHFEDLLRIDDRSMQKLLSEVDLKTLALALKNAPDTIKDKILRNLSQRAQEMLKEELEFLGAVPAPQIKQAQKQVVEAIQRLDQAGELVMLE